MSQGSAGASWSWKSPERIPPPSLRQKHGPADTWAPGMLEGTHLCKPRKGIQPPPGNQGFKGKDVIWF